MSVPVRPRGGVRSWRDLARGPVSPAALALALYTFLLLSRLPELFAFIGVFRPIILLALITIALAWALPQSRLPAVLAAPETRAVFGIFALALVGVVTSTWPGGSFRYVAFGLSKTLLFFLLLLYCLRAFLELRYLVWAYVGSIAALELGVLVLNVKDRARITGTYDPNDLAFVMVCALPMAIMLFLVERGLLRYAMLPVVLLGLITIIMTKSRGGFITLVVVGVIILAKLPSRIPLLRTGLLLGGILIFSLFAPQSYWDRMTTIWGDEEEQTEERIERPKEASQDDYLKGGFSPRWDVWMTGVRLMLENPILGVGINAFALAERGQTFGGGWKAAHNSFTQIGAELGVLGLALFVFLLYRSIRNYRMVIRIARSVPQLQYHLWVAHGFETGIYGYIIAGAALNHAYSNIFYYLVAMSVALKWVTLRDRARLDAPGSAPSEAGRSLPWWKAPR
jgi:putative inorganic carbon (hco3(-)) transporter